MKKVFLFAAIAAMLTACSSEELSNKDATIENGVDAPVAFSVYTQRAVTRAGLAGEITTDGLKTGTHKDVGFGVFGYYSNGETYASANTFPNFMYNQQVKWNATVTPNAWTYDPVKYWPNEYGNAAKSDDVDRVSFFAYAPWTLVTPSTGIPVVTNATSIADYDAFAASLGIAGVTDLATYKTYGSFATDDAAKAALDAINQQQILDIQNKNITALTRNTATGDPFIKYVVDPNPATSVDLLWGVAAVNYKTEWNSTVLTNITAGKPFIDLVKPNDQKGDGSISTDDPKVNFNLRHALAKLNVTIDYIDDAATPGGSAVGTIEGDPVTTKIFIREITIGGFVMKGALNLNNTSTGSYTDGWDMSATPVWTNPTPIPNWKAYDGVSEIDNDDETISFKDGRRDGKEGALDAENSSEKYLGLNPVLIQSKPYSTIVDAGGVTKFTDANVGVTKTKVNLFNSATATAPIYVIPRNKPIDIEIIYDVETVNPKLSTYLSDGVTHGSTIENKIRKKSTEIFISTNPIKMQAGVGYTLNIHLGMTSVKVDAVVENWVDGGSGNAKLP